MIVELFASLLIASLISQNALDEVVESQVTMFEHQEDVDDVVGFLEKSGATKEMFANSYKAVMEKTIDRVDNREKLLQFCSAASCFADVTAGTERSRELLPYVRKAKVELVASDVMNDYASRGILDHKFIQWSKEELERPECFMKVRSRIWSCFYRISLSKDIHDEVKKDLLAYIRENACSGISAAWFSEKILLKEDATYKTSELRLKIAEFVLGYEGTKAKETVKYFTNVLEEMERR